MADHETFLLLLTSYEVLYTGRPYKSAGLTEALREDNTKFGRSECPCIEDHVA